MEIGEIGKNINEAGVNRQFLECNKRINYTFIHTLLLNTHHAGYKI